MKTMNEKDKNELLEQALNNGEVYKAKVWGCIMANMKTILKYSVISSAVAGVAGALSNEYCYVGLTETRFVFYVMKTLDCSKVKYAFEVPLNQVDVVKVKKSIIPGRCVLKIYTGKECIKLSLVNNTIGTDIKNQKEGIAIISSEMKNRYND